ncbi:hypothetical protein E1B25_18740 [Antarcticimicrobium sediminis]|uniref:Uncharacterized protein n=2 Tax=Antarcticimicrobium sediminis TaxID=2546227 RepID=A0A4R5EJK3_9RHOB|nr:hypothetical protein E1B25_18740 [Antarcticimicrobium sediminis]
MQATALMHALRKRPFEGDAYDCLLRARRYTAPLNETMYAEARDLLETTIELGPNRHEDVLVDVQRISMPDFYWMHVLNAAAFGHLGRMEASASLAKMKEVKPGVSAAEEIQKWNVAPRNYAHIMEGLRKAGYDE